MYLWSIEDREHDRDGILLIDLKKRNKNFSMNKFKVTSFQISEMNILTFYNELLMSVDYWEVCDTFNGCPWELLENEWKSRETL